MPSEIYQFFCSVLIGANIEYKALEGKGRVSAKQVDKKAFGEYDIFNKTQKIESDFDRAIKMLEKKNKKK